MIFAIFHIVAVLALLAYLAASWCYIQALLSANSSLNLRVGYNMPRSEMTVNKSGRLLLRIGLAAHLAWVLYVLLLGLPSERPYAELIFQSHLDVILTGPGVVSFISLACIFAFLVGERFPPIGMLGALLVPISASLLLVAVLTFHLENNAGVGHPSSASMHPFGIFTLHLGCIILSIASYMFSFCLSIALIVQDKLVRRGRIGGLASRLPPIAKLDKLNIAFLTAGFVFLVFGLGLGFWQAFYYGMKEVGRGAKLCASIFAFLIYFLIIVSNLSWNIRGRRLAWLSITGFVVLLLTLWLSILVGIN